MYPPLRPHGGNSSEGLPLGAACALVMIAAVHRNMEPRIREPFDSLPCASFQQGTHGSTPGDDDGRIKVRKRIENESPFMQPWMRQGKAGLVTDQIIVKQQIEIQHARRPFFRPRSATELFDPHQLREQ